MSNFKLNNLDVTSVNLILNGVAFNNIGTVRIVLNGAAPVTVFSSGATTTTTTTSAPQPTTTTTTQAPSNLRTATYIYIDSIWASKTFTAGTSPGEPNNGNPEAFGGWAPSVFDTYQNDVTFQWISLG